MGTNINRPKRYILTGGVLNQENQLKNFTITIDTATDISIISKKMMEGLEPEFTSEINQHNPQSCEINIELKPSTMYVQFYVCDTH